MVNREEYELRKKAIFDTMGRRGQERILRIGYENWDPFQEPKDPRERIFSTVSLQANELLKEFYQARLEREESVDQNRELFELCRGLLQGERRAQVILEFCNWYKEKLA
jgi:hypothetical protein